MAIKLREGILINNCFHLPYYILDFDHHWRCEQFLEQILIISNIDKMVPFFGATFRQYTTFMTNSCNKFDEWLMNSTNFLSFQGEKLPLRLIATDIVVAIFAVPGGCSLQSMRGKYFALHLMKILNVYHSYLTYNNKPLKSIV